MITGARVTYYADDGREQLLRDCVLPLVAQIGADQTVWARRHWRFGPHFEVLCSGDAQETVAHEAAGVLTAYVGRHPSDGLLDVADYRRRSVELGRLELIEAPYEPLHEDNSVVVASADAGDTFIRTETAQLAKGRILAEGTVLAAVLAQTSDRRQLADAVFAGMAAIAVAYPERGLVSGYQAFLSHWKEHFHWSDPQGAADALLRRAYEAQRDGLTRRLRDIDETSDPVGAAWRSWVGVSMPIALQTATSGDVLPYPHADRAAMAARFGRDTGVRWSGSDDRGYSDYHRSFRRLDFTRLGDGHGFAAYRFLINAFFDILSLAGVTPRERYSVAHLFTSASQDVLGETWQETVGHTLAGQGSDGPVVPTLPWKGSHG